MVYHVCMGQDVGSNIQFIRRVKPHVVPICLAIVFHVVMVWLVSVTSPVTGPWSVSGMIYFFTYLVLSPAMAIVLWWRARKIAYSFMWIFVLPFSLYIPLVSDFVEQLVFFVTNLSG